MLKLIQLELIKYKINGYVRVALIAMACIFGLICLIAFNRSEGQAFQDSETLFFAIDTFTKGTFIVFASVLLSRFIIDEYRTKSITVLFMYPINRKKLMIAKLFIVFSFTFISIVLCNLIVGSLMLLLNHFYEFMNETLTVGQVGRQALAIIMNALAASFISLIPLFFGMRKYSTAATIITSVLIVIAIYNVSDGFSLNSIVVIPIALSWIGAIIAYASFRNIERKDINP
ncbi:ABC transporter permease [Cohnella nanjingensis]|uniref:ABC transporter permease n=1 Tax=Cohnella nanjingensis TaxID=1387779 RepID=A0A7X0RR41_9BACL|nr:ABC transporter permease [Cohnella nanjingensis]MBB6672005.1 ABC transporter permease [Cohnella nanjingensis]